MKLFPVVVFCLVAAASAAAQGDSTRAKPRAVGIIDGLVSDSALAPLNEVTISFVGGTTQVVTGVNGKFRFLEVPVGRYQILARKIGTEPVIAEVDVVADQVARLAMMLEPVATELKGVRVEAAAVGSIRLRGFEERRKASGTGFFMTAAQIENSRVLTGAELVARAPNLLVRSFDAAGVGGKAVSLRLPTKLRCPMHIVLDGIPLGDNLGDLPSPKELAGIEIYHGPASMPLEFKRWSGAAYCGLIVAWTKDGSERP
jgi:hypothetical protein